MTDLPAPGTGRTVAFHTLGCKVNQYDSQAMLELFLAAGYEARAFEESADVYVINTCVVTGTGEKKSLQALRRALRRNPAADVVVAGCLAQRDADRLLDAGASLVIGNRDRSRVVDLLAEAACAGRGISAVGSLEGQGFEPLRISASEGHSRAFLKIQEGCDARCAYCAIPAVRGAVRSRPLYDIRAEAERLARAGYQELVLTGIHLGSYGLDLPETGLLDALRAAHDVPGLRRLRLSSLEPRTVTESFVAGLKDLPRLCPQFHLSLQSGSDAVLARMRRRYTAGSFLSAARRLREAFGDAALTTDVIAGFPGETEEEFEETLRVCRLAGFARMHVFPFSPRPGTEAASLPGALPRRVKEARARRLSALGRSLARDYAAGLVGSVQEVLFEERGGGYSHGYTPQYLAVRVPGAWEGIRRVLLESAGEEGCLGRVL